MGLTIHYGLSLDKVSLSEVRKKLAALHSAAMDLPFQQVGDVREWTGDQCCPDKRPADAEREERWLLGQSQKHVTFKWPAGSRRPQLCASDDKERFVYWASQSAKQIIGFKTKPGDGCEPANFGLCQYPAMFVAHRGETETARMRLPKTAQWTWKSFCKTIYASDPEYGGLRNFLRCHGLVVRLLDVAKTLGFVVYVNDESGYYEHRDLTKLAQEATSDLQSLAKIAGELQDVFGKEKLEAPVMRRADFEQLEAQATKKG